MPIHPIEPTFEKHYIDRLLTLDENSERKFGTLTPAGMCRHMRTSFEAAVGIGNVKDISTPVVRSVIFFLTTRVIKVWPGGKIKAPGYWAPAPDYDFQKEQQLLIEAIQVFLSHTPDPSKANPHPLFGPLTHRQWELLLGPHLHHHLRQFGI
ncbi:MAG: hypothetical protein COA73_18190 [Candidatus Hydrogenedentota bacterium]|nr:MAG: hypothetical protein COA73_18190 [Candidatus Hydrogenedentota bacterium]